jgi:hypothetical protein
MAAQNAQKDPGSIRSFLRVLRIFAANGLSL